MATEDHIPRLSGDPDGLDFDGIRSKGIAMLQDLSSAQWTDYNLHDPGVTLLEMLSYGLTDLVYRTDFDVADMLTNPSGNIDFDEQALFRPQDILPSAPVTDIDFCKLIYNRLPEVDDVWLRTAQHPDAVPGLFTVYIKRSESLSGAALTDQALRRKVFDLLAAHRNLCRDIGQVCIVSTERYTLGGEIEIDGSRPAAEIYAEIYFRCAKLVSSGGQIIRYEEALAQGMSWEQMLEGTRTDHGYIADAHFTEANYEIDVIRLITRVRHIRGVKRVNQLYLRDAQGRHLDARKTDAGQVCPVLGFPRDPADTQSLRLTHGESIGQYADEVRDDTPQMAGRQALQFHEQVTLYLRKLEFEYDAFRSSDGQLDRLLVLPSGSYRDLAEYSSVGEHTPAIYGINHYGVPKSEPPEVHARARQLKAYLYPFEQIMANYLASLQGMRSLYSTNAALDRTYFAQFLGNSEIPNVDILYCEGVMASRIDEVLSEQDLFTGRRNRVLDSLLAVYGEVFPDDALRRHDPYHVEHFEWHLIDCKIGLLQQLCELGGQRGQAMNTQAPYGDGNNYAAIQRRVQWLAGMSGQIVGRPLAYGVNDGKVRFLSDQRYRDGLAKQAGYPLDVPHEESRALPWTGGPATGGSFALPQEAVSASLLLAGIHRENYRVLPAEEGQGWLCLYLDDAHCWPLALLPLADLEDAAAQLRSRLIEINRSYEGFHVLEHILLRPRGEQPRRNVAREFYGHRVSIMLPAFTARFSIPECRAWLEQLIAQHLPAHILPDFYWLDYAFLAQFERRYQAWLTLLNALEDGGDVDGLDAAAEQLIELLGKFAPYQSQRYWV